MTGRKRRVPVPSLLGFLASAYPDAKILLDYRTPFELLVATVLAAQCTDERVNRVTPSLFARYPDPASMASADLRELEEAVRPTGFYRNKAAAIRGLSEALIARHGGAVPDTMEALTALPGVGRKTASILLGGVFGRNALPVDTHVARVSFRLGLTASREADRIERDLAAAVPEREWWTFATRLGWHGRRVCVARTPRCGGCGLSGSCPRAGVARTR
ncbi:MAG: endonuclease III [Deltaproteobacteria bacterium]